MTLSSRSCACCWFLTASARIVHYVNPKDIDPVLIRLDYLIFGGDPAVMLEKIMNPFLTDVLEIAYTTYYFMAISLGVMLLLHHKREEFNRTIFLVLFCFYLSYLGYILFPCSRTAFRHQRSAGCSAQRVPCRGADTEFSELARRYKEGCIPQRTHCDCVDCSLSLIQVRKEIVPDIIAGCPGADFFHGILPVPLCR